jgi:glycosyltransferase involved in cell wall biosynthesis
MRVLFWVGGFLPSIGGVQRLAAQLLPALEQRGYRYVVVTTHRDGDGPGVSHYGKIPVHRISFGNAWSSIDRLVQVRQQIAELKRSFAPDLIHIYGLSPSNSFHHLTTPAYSAPVLVSLHSTWGPLAERTLRDATWVVCCSQALLKTAQQLVPAILPRSSVIYNGRGQPPFEPRPLSAHPPRLLCVGRLAPEKGFDIALAAFGKILDRFPNARMIIAGDGTEKESFRRQIDALDLTDRVELIGWVPQGETFRLFDSATLVIIPSRREGFSLVAVEAASMARPVVATRVGGLPEVVLHEKTGLLVPAENSDTLAEAISFLLEHPETATRMGDAGRRRAARKFRWDRYVDAYDALYQQLIFKKDLCPGMAERVFRG